MLEYKVDINEGAVMITGLVSDVNLKVIISNKPRVYEFGNFKWVVKIPKFICGCPVIKICPLVEYRDNYITDLIIPSSVIELSDYAFAAWDLTGIMIPNSVVNIGERSLCACFSLKYINNIEIINDFCIINDKFQYKDGLITKIF